MPTSPATQTRSRGRRRVLVVVASLVGVVVLAGLGLALWAYQSLNSNISTIDASVNDALGTARPEKENEAMNILAIGSDSREGANSFVGGESPGLADTTMVVHLAADNSWAAGVSIPRDSMVQMPDCVKPDGSVYPGGFRQFNEAYQIGGPLCVQRTVESLTDLRIDHFVEVDFSGFMNMVDAVGGVTVYIPEPISDPNSNIFFEAGCQKLSGKKALQYVRVRHGVDDGSDTARIKRQQAFLSSLIQKVSSSGVMFNPLELYKFLDAATKSVTTDTGLGGIDKMAPLAVRVRDIGLDRIDFTTVPVAAWPQNPNRLLWLQPDADKLWRQLADDEPLTAAKPKPTAEDSASGSAQPSGAGSKSASPTTRSAKPSKSASPSSTYDTRKADDPICPQD